jgi:hypothetical protein
MTENKYYLQSVELIYNENNYLYYYLIYSNGILKTYIDLPFEKNLKIDIELKI